MVNDSRFKVLCRAKRQSRANGSRLMMKEIVKGVWLMKLCLFVVMIRTRDRREGRSKLKGEPLETRNERKREALKK